MALLAIACRDGFAASHLFHSFSTWHQEEAFELPIVPTNANYSAALLATSNELPTKMVSGAD